MTNRVTIMSENGKRQQFKKYEQLLQKGNETHKTNGTTNSNNESKQPMQPKQSKKPEKLRNQTIRSNRFLWGRRQA